MSTPEDPYFAGRVAIKGLGDRVKPFAPGWVAVYLVNLIVPLILGGMLTDKFSGLGMLLATLLLLAMGGYVSSVSRKIGVALVVGGWFVAASQLFPLVQFFAGTIGLAAAQAMGLTTKHGPLIRLETVLGGFIATSLTGTLLICLALIIGKLMLWVRSWSELDQTVHPNVGKAEV